MKEDGKKRGGKARGVVEGGAQITLKMTIENTYEDEGF
jgi:hypothetical protein